MKIVELYEVNSTSGFGETHIDTQSKKVIARFTNPEAAHDFALSEAGRDAHGQPGEIVPVVLELCETAEEAGAENKQDVITRALAKLDPAELAALRALKATDEAFKVNI